MLKRFFPRNTSQAIWYRMTFKLGFTLPFTVISGLLFWLALLLLLSPSVYAYDDKSSRVISTDNLQLAMSDRRVGLSDSDWQQSTDRASLNQTTEKTGYVIKDSEKSFYFERPPERIAVLNWDLTEQLIELGVTPVAIPEIDACHEWVVRPRVPDSTEELGLRDEPNLERLAAIKPDLILITHRHKALKKRLMRIAPVLYFDTFSKHHNNAEAAVETFRTLARLVQKEALAEQKLQQMQARVDQLKNKLQQAFNGKLPEVTTIRFASLTSVYVYGDNSMSQYALEMLGIRPAMPQPMTQWGITQTRLLNLRDINQGVVLYFTPFEQEKKLKGSAIWQAMPFVRSGRSNRIKPAWTYGGAMSLGYMAEALTESLLEIAPQYAGNSLTMKPVADE